MTNREMFLLATTILFASTTAGMALQGAMHHGPRPGFDRPHGDRDARHAERGARMFQETDTNTDGFITRDEMLAKQQARVDEMFTTIDADKDGKLSKDEMAKGRELMRAKWKAKFDAERAAPAAAPAPAPAQ